MKSNKILAGGVAGVRPETNEKKHGEAYKKDGVFAQVLKIEHATGNMATRRWQLIMFSGYKSEFPNRQLFIINKQL